MAEVYGTKPKLFTREWWPYFWTYYKWQTVIFLAVIIALTATIYQNITSVDYDVEVMYLTDKKAIATEDEKALGDALKRFMVDADDDGEINVFINQIILAGTEEQVGYDANLIMKHDLDMAEKNMYLCIYDTPNFERVKNRSGFSEAYLPMDAWCESSPEKVLCDDRGVIYGVSIEGSKVLEDCGISSQDLYVLVKNDMIDDDKNELAKENAIAIANNLIK